MTRSLPVKVERKTKETHITVELNTKETVIETQCGFLNHMLNTLSKHSQLHFSLKVLYADTFIDDHHMVEDVAIVLGNALRTLFSFNDGMAIHVEGVCVHDGTGNNVVRQNWSRFGTAYAPLDEALARCVVDISNRPFAHVQLDLKRDYLHATQGGISCEMLVHFLKTLITESRMTVHLDVLRGDNDHHKAECAFKALALALKQAMCVSDIGDVASTKGTL